MRNLVWPAMIVLWALLITGIVLNQTAILAVAFAGFVGLAIRQRRAQKRPAPVRSRCLQQIGTTHKSHPCTLPADGHTMHRCAFGDCSWGHF